MSPPVRLVTKPASDQKTQESIISQLEGTLAEAKAGKLHGLVLATKDVDGWAHRAAHGLNLQEEIGGIFLLLVERAVQILGTYEDE